MTLKAVMTYPLPTPIPYHVNRLLGWVRVIKQQYHPTLEQQLPGWSDALFKVTDAKILRYSSWTRGRILVSIITLPGHYTVIRRYGALRTPLMVLPNAT